MSLRLVRKNRRGFQLDDGRIIWQMMGAEGEGDPADEDTGDGEDDADEAEEDDSKPDKGSEEDPEKERLKNRMRAADRRAAAAEQKLRDKELEGASELERTKAELEQAQSVNEELNAELMQLRRERAFLGSNTVTWHDPEIALGKLDWESLTDEDGTVDVAALEKAVKDLAKSKPFLVKKDVVDDEEGTKPPASPSAGGKPGTGKKQTKAELDRAALEKKYPALRG